MRMRMTMTYVRWRDLVLSVLVSPLFLITGGIAGPLEWLRSEWALFKRRGAR